MAGLRDAMVENAPAVLALGGLAIGLVFGFAVYRTNFCTMGAIADFVNFGDWRRFRAWVLAAATALVGAQVLHATGLVALDKSLYVGANLNWAGHIVGGAMFGFGMVLGGGCASRNLVRVGGGDLRALLTLIVLAIFAFMAMGGLLGPVRNMLEQATAIDLKALGVGSQSLGALAGKWTGWPAARATAALAVVVAGLALAYCFADAAFRGSRGHVASGLVVGLCAVAGWALTGLAYDDMAERPMAPGSLTFVRPAGDTLEWLQRFTAGRIPGFGVATVFGSILGAYIAARLAGRFHLTTFSGTADTLRSLTGGALMGIGGVLALGCTIGQGVTGISTLALGSFLTFPAIVFGGIQGIRYLERALMAEA